MLPKKLSDVLREVSPRKLRGTAYHNPNRFDTLRQQARSISRDSRHRSLSVKRRLDMEPSEATNQPQTNSQPPQTSPTTYTIQMDSDALDTLKFELTKVASLCDKIASDIENANINPEMKTITGGLLEAIRGLGIIQGKLLPNTKTTDNLAKPLYSDMLALNIPQHAQPKRPRTENNTTTQSSTSNPPPSRETPYQAKLGKFREAVKNAEKSTLIFNLDLGRVPIMNQDTMSTRASLALSKMAASTEKANSTIPSEDVRDTLDDVLGMAKGITFFGKQTKTYRNPKDPQNSGAFCTLPVKYDFKDRDTRARAEAVLRERCKVNCATPYPTILRECIKQAANAVKQKFPDSIVRVNVDAKNFTLKLAKKKPGDLDFQFWDTPVPLPHEALDTQAKKIPEGFLLKVDLTPSPQRQSRRDTHEMETLSQDDNQSQSLNQGGSQNE